MRQRCRICHNEYHVYYSQIDDPPICPSCLKFLQRTGQSPNLSLVVKGAGEYKPDEREREPEPERRGAFADAEAAGIPPAAVLYTVVVGVAILLSVVLLARAAPAAAGGQGMGALGAAAFAGVTLFAAASLFFITVSLIQIAHTAHKGLLALGELSGQLKEARGGGEKPSAPAQNPRA
jgi:predicted nucleic acid-binding Zn ribbon protein/preprotein translocase subunit SecG